MSKKSNPNLYKHASKLLSVNQLVRSDNWNKPKKMQKKFRKKKKKVVRVHRQSKPKPDMFFTYNRALGPPYRILMDTNFIHFSATNKLDIIQTAMNSLYAKVVPVVTDCVIGELERLGTKFKVALKVAKDPRFERLRCNHKGIYADDCICRRVKKNPVYVVGTCDKDLKRRLRKIVGVPIMYIYKKCYVVERLPDAQGMAKML